MTKFKTSRTEIDIFKDNLIACGLGHLIDGITYPPSDAQKTIERQLGSALLEAEFYNQPEGPIKEQLRAAILHVRQAAALIMPNL